MSGYYVEHKGNFLLFENAEAWLWTREPSKATAFFHLKMARSVVETLHEYAAKTNWKHSPFRICKLQYFPIKEAK